MNQPYPYPSNTAPKNASSIWALDVCVLILAGLIIYLSIDKLSFSDPRWLYNAWTYLISVPFSALLLSLLSHFMLSKRVQKSIQIGFLFSLLLHLLLLVLAINVVIFNGYFPNALTKPTSQAARPSKTLPDYLFKPETARKKAADWLRPVTASTQAKSLTLPDSIKSDPLNETNLSQQVNPASIEFDTFAENFNASIQKDSSEPTIQKVARSTARDNTLLQTQLMDRNAPVAPLVAPAAESDRGNAEKTLSTQVRRVAPLSSSLQRPATQSPRVKEKRSELSTTNIVADSDLPNIRDVRSNRPSSIRSSPPLLTASESVPTTPDSNLQESVPKLPNVQITELGGQLRKTPSPETKLSNRLKSQDFDPLPLQSDRPEIVEAFSKPDRALPLAPQTKTTSGKRAIRPKLNQSSTFATMSSPQVPKVLSPPRQRPSTAGLLGAASTGIDRSTPPNENRMPANSLNSRSNSMKQDSEPELNADKSIASTSPLNTLSIRTNPSIPDISEDTIRPRIENKVQRYELVTPPTVVISPVPSFTRRVLRKDDLVRPVPEKDPPPPAAAEDAIERGLRYLSSTQNLDGSWSLQGHGSEVVLQSDSAATGLALLAFQGAGYTHQRHQHADTVKRGLSFLVSNQQSDGNLFQLEDAISNRNVAFYSHGIAALSLCEAYGMTQDPNLRVAAQKSLDYIISTQHRQRGGWRYTAQISSDTSVTGWMMMALKSGELAGLEISQQTYRGIKYWLSLSQSDEKADRYRYNPFAPDTPSQRHGRVETPTMTAVGGLMRMYSGWRRDTPEMQSIADYLIQSLPESGTTANPKRDTYYWYYATQVMFHMGGEHWRAWNDKLTPLLIKTQVKSGPENGSWDPLKPVPDRWSFHAGRIYITTMNLLNLEIYYRHLPIYDETLAR